LGTTTVEHTHTHSLSRNDVQPSWSVDSVGRISVTLEDFRPWMHSGTGPVPGQELIPDASTCE